MVSLDVISVLSDVEICWNASIASVSPFPGGVDELYCRVSGVVKDLDRLKSLYYLFAEMLNHLCHIGSACGNVWGS